MSQKNEAKRAGVFGSILGGTVSLTASTLAVKILGLVYKIPLARILTDEGMGYFNSAYTVFGLFYLLCTAGVPKAVMILCSEANYGEDDRVDKLVKIAMRTFFAIGLGVTVLFTVFSFPLARLIGNGGAAFTMLSIAPSILFVALGGVLRGYLTSRSRYLDIAVSGVIEGVAKLVLGLIFGYVGIRMALPLEIVSALTILGTTLGAIFAFLYLYSCSKSEKKEYNPRQSLIFPQKREVIAKIFRISVPITLSSAVMSLTNIIDLALVMRRLSDGGYTEAEASALYGNYTTLAVSMFNFALSVITPVSVIFLPHFTRSLAAKDFSAYNGYMESSLRIVSFLSAPMTFGLAFYSYEILALIFGAEAAAVGAPLLTLISPAVLFSSLLIIINTSLEAGGLVKIPIYSMLVGAFVKIAVGYFLIADSRFGICGAPVGTVFSYVASFVVSCAVYLRKQGSRLPIFSASLAPYFSAAVAVVLSKGVYIYLENKLFPQLALAASILLCALIYLGISAFFGGFGKMKNGLLAKYTNFA